MSKIIVRNIFKSFKNNNVLAGLTFECDNEIVFIAGRNGAGKTTFIRIALKLERADKGEISLEFNNTSREKKVGAVFDTPCLYRQMSCKENLHIHCTGYLSDKKHVKTILDNLRIDKEILRKKAGNCSFGQQHRVSVAIELIRKPEILFLDEPTIGLDPISWELIKKSIIENKKAQRGCVIVTGQDYFELGKMADKILILENGKAQYFGTIPGFLASAPEMVLLKTNTNELPEIIKEHCLSNASIDIEGLYAFVLLAGKIDILQCLRENNIPIVSLDVHKPDLKSAILAVYKNKEERGIV